MDLRRLWHNIRLRIPWMVGTRTKGEIVMRTTHDLLTSQVIQILIRDREMRGYGELADGEFADGEMIVTDVRTQMNSADDFDRKLQASLSRAGSILFHAPVCELSSSKWTPTELDMARD